MTNSRCKNCGYPLTDGQVDAGKCPRCGEKTPDPDPRRDKPGDARRQSPEPNRKVKPL
jgi:uncharacterized Zn finger protein (UPF0148 family)